MNCSWPQTRAGLLAATLAVLASAAIWIACQHKPLDRALPPFVFPPPDGFGEWAPALLPPEDPAAADPILAHTMRYRFQKEREGLGVEMRAIADLSVHYIRNPRLEMRFLPHGYLPLDAGMTYLVDSAGIVRTNAAGNSMGLGPLSIRLRPATGSYGFWQAAGRWHLSATMTPDGQLHATRKEVARQTYFWGISAAAVGQWLCGKAPLPDSRVATLHLALRNPEAGREQAERELEAALLEWLPRCRNQFPKPGH